MPDTQNIRRHDPPPAEHDHPTSVRASQSPSRRAAAIEAAYILEAVRK